MLMGNRFKSRLNLAAYSWLKQLAWLGYPLMMFFLSRTLLILVGYVAEIALPSQQGQDFWQISSENIFLDIWARWDSGYYLNIVESGYFFHPGEKSTVAFFPLYPLLLDLLNGLINNPVLAGIWISNVSFVAALAFFYLLCRLELGEQVARRSLFYLCFFPTSFFFSAVYTESSFLLFAVASMYFARKQRWGWAGIMGAICASSRIVGVIMWGVIGLEWLKRHGWQLSKIQQKSTWSCLWPALRQDWRSLVAISATPLGLLAYMYFLQQNFADAFAFMTVQAAWGRESLGTLAILYHDINGLAQQELLTGQGDIWWQVVFDSAAFFLAISSSFFIWRRLGSSYALYVLLSAVIPSLSSSQSLMRYILGMFPVFMMLGLWGQSKHIHQGLSMLFAMLLALFFTLFVNWYFVA